LIELPKPQLLQIDIASAPFLMALRPFSATTTARTITRLISVCKVPRFPNPRNKPSKLRVDN
jgi:hypothetical protein